MLAIVALWAAVLGPVWLRRHDAIYESRSVDKFNAAMRVLARRGPRPIAGIHARAVLMPGRPDVAPVSEVMVSGIAGDQPGQRSRRSASIYRLRRNLACLALFDFFTIAIWAGIGSTAVLGLHLIGDILTGVAVMGLRQAMERESRLMTAESRRRRVATVMAREQAAVAQTVPRRSSAPIWHDPLATPAAVAADAAFAESATAEEIAEQRTARAKRLPATSLSRKSAIIDLTMPGNWREEVDLGDVDEEIRQAAMIADDSALDNLIARRRRVV